MELLEFADKYNGLAGTAALFVLAYHLWKCEKRSANVWTMLNTLHADVNKVKGKLNIDSS